ncbi:zinc finger protein 525-like [Pollicipes pollicipes]|uniref:zinc finger protein 525-like n=1 Tax=Pollicipes pollicipes TaxID=41117 RepID=UPI00188501B7|nr:zinc finger protein 525-like [Pollicipes pollicipes]
MSYSAFLGDCQYRSARRGNLSRHRVTMHRQLAEPLLCCRASFDTKHAYEQHRRRAHAAGYSCGECGRTFGRRALMTRHSYIHAARKPFECVSCRRYTTASKSNLRRHLQDTF